MHVKLDLDLLCSSLYLDTEEKTLNVDWPLQHDFEHLLPDFKKISKWLSEHSEVIACIFRPQLHTPNSKQVLASLWEQKKPAQSWTSIVLDIEALQREFIQRPQLMIWDYGDQFINGPLLELSLSFDLRMAHTDATFKLNYREESLPPSIQSFKLLHYLAGGSVQRHALLTNEIIKANRMLSRGLINLCYQNGQQRHEWWEAFWEKELSSPQLMRAYTKQILAQEVIDYITVKEPQEAHRKAIMDARDWSKEEQTSKQFSSPRKFQEGVGLQGGKP